MNTGATLLALDDKQIFTVLLVAFGFVIALISIVGGMTHNKSIRKLKAEEKIRRQREQTYSEVAAYIAEGSMTPEEGERLIRAMKEGDEPIDQAFARADRA